MRDNHVSYFIKGIIMFVFSKKQRFQDSDAVQRILVFSNQAMMDQYEKAFAAEVEQFGSLYAHDNNMGAIYKLCAVQTSKGTWQAVTRCGFTGSILGTVFDLTDTDDQALEASMNLLKLYVVGAFDRPVTTPEGYLYNQKAANAYVKENMAEYCDFTTESEWKDFPELKIKVCNRRGRTIVTDGRETYIHGPGTSLARADSPVCAMAYIMASEK